MTIMYDGKGYSGFQVQPNGKTIQGEIERALTLLFKKDIKIYASGRTDAGVSALAQVAHFDLEEKIDEKKLKSSLNAKLDGIAITKIVQADGSFDARFNVKRKTYQYLFYVSRDELPLYSGRAVRINDYADIKLMNEACKFLIGKHDFKSFVARKSGKTDFVRTIFDAKIVSLIGDIYALEITGDGFLYNMVRIIFGTLVNIGYGKLPPEKMADIIRAEDRKFAGKTYPAEALYLKNVAYSDENKKKL